MNRLIYKHICTNVTYIRRRGRARDEGIHTHIHIHSITCVIFVFSCFILQMTYRFCIQPFMLQYTKYVRCATFAAMNFLHSDTFFSWCWWFGGARQSIYHISFVSLVRLSRTKKQKQQQLENWFHLVSVTRELTSCWRNFLQ